MQAGVKGSEFRDRGSGFREFVERTVQMVRKYINGFE